MLRPEFGELPASRRRTRAFANIIGGGFARAAGKGTQLPAAIGRNPVRAVVVAVADPRQHAFQRFTSQ